jgi:voltage-gated potassium channel
MATEHSYGRLLSGRAAVLLPTLVAVLSLATGITNITVGITIAGPFAEFVPEVLRQAAGFTGALTGFVMLLGARALQRRLRVGWYLTLLLLPVTAAQGLVQASAYSLPLVVLSLASVPALLLHDDQFDRQVSLSNAQIAAIIALTGTLAYGTVGTFTLRDEYHEVETVADAFYYTVVTASTVGYGDMTPLSQQARLFGLSVVVLGTASFAVALGSVLGPAIEARFARTLGTMTGTEYDLLEDHVVVLGYGDLTEPLLEELGDRRELVVVTPDRDVATRLRNREVNVVVGDPTDEQLLQQTGIEQAQTVIAATEDDAQDALAILTARELTADARIIAAATARENVQKLRQAGADVAFSPAVIGGQLLGRSATDETDIDEILASLSTKPSDE